MNRMQQWLKPSTNRPQIDRMAEIEVVSVGGASLKENRAANVPCNGLQPLEPNKHRHTFHLKPALSILLTASLVLLVGIAPGNTQVQERKPNRTIVASGRGIVTIPTTIAQIRLAIEVSGKTPIGAQQEAAKRATQVVNFLKTQQIEKLQTTGISLNPTYTYPPNATPKLTGYTATNSISFRVTNERAGAILDAAVNNGATRIEGVNLVASEQAISTAQLQALKQATQDAQRQADAVLEALSLKRKEVIGVRIDSASNPVPIAMSQAAFNGDRASKPAPTTPVVGGEQQVEAAVTLDIGY